MYTYSDSEYTDDDGTPQTASNKSAPKALESALAEKGHAPEKTTANNAPGASLSAKSSENNQQLLKRVEKDRSETDTETKKDTVEILNSNGEKIFLVRASGPSLPVCSIIITPVSKTDRLSGEALN